VPGRPVVSERAASLREADPRLAAALAAGGATALADAPLLPVLTLAAGRWEPPEPGTLGPWTARLIVLAGWLWHAGGDVFGPGDGLDPWDDGAGAWYACTAARLAVIGAAFAAALEAARDVAGAGATPQGHTLRVAESSGEAPQERLLALLWRLAARWGRSGSDGTALPPELDAAALAGLLDVPGEQAELALAALLADGAVHPAGDGGWQLPAPPQGAGLRGRRDELRARLAAQLALARAVTADARALTEELRAERRRASAARRPSA
jgi:hypothetical protein